MSEIYWKDEKCDVCKSRPSYGIEHQYVGDRTKVYIGYAECKCIKRTINHTVIDFMFGNTKIDIDCHIKKSSSIRFALNKYFDELITRNGGWNNYWKLKKLRLPGSGKSRYFYRKPQT